VQVIYFIIYRCYIHIYIYIYIYIYILFTIIYVYKTNACRYADLVAEQKLVAQGVEKATKVPLDYFMLHNYIII
jgi:hypothetical protein